MAEWTAEQIDLLKKLWSDTPQMSTLAIARRMGLSKNAVVGKAHRISLPSRPSPIKKDGSGGVTRRRVTSLRRATRITSLPLLASVAVEKIVAPEPATKPAPKAIIVKAAANGTCLFPLWGNRDRPTHEYCGKPSQGSWCPECRLKVFTRHPNQMGIAAE